MGQYLNRDGQDPAAGIVPGRDSLLHRNSVPAVLRACVSLTFALVVVGCAPTKSMKVLIHMIPDQERYFSEEVVPQFEEEQKAELDVVHLGSLDSMEHELDRLGGEVGLVKVPFGKSWSLVRDGHIMPLNSFLSEEERREYRETYLLTSLARADGKHYFVPRKFETRIMVYCKSKVTDALESWRSQKDSLDAALRKFNGYGLPATYLLESDPNEWDYFDVFVVGWIWANRSYGGKTAPRVAHRGKRYSGTSLRIVDRVFQCGGDSTKVLRMEGDAVVDAMHWEAVYAAGGIYNQRMWEEQWSGTGVWKGFASGDVFLSFMTQLDCFFIHGTGRDGLEGYLSDPDDMGVAVMPQGCSVELDRKGDVLRSGEKSITTGGWWWGIPSDTPYPRLSYDLARHITSTTSQVQGCTRFGMIPVRKDILSDMSMMFGGGWITEVYQTSLRQLMENGNTIVPVNPRFGQIANLYLSAWFDVVVDRNWSPNRRFPDRNHIEKVLNTTYASRAAALLGG